MNGGNLIDFFNHFALGKIGLIYVFEIPAPGLLESWLRPFTLMTTNTISLPDREASELY